MVVSKNKCAILAVTLICVAMLCCALYFGGSVEDVMAVTDTSASNTDIIRIGEIYKGVDSVNNIKHFAGENLSKLYEAIGGSNSTYASIDNILLSSSEITSDNIRSFNGGKDVVVSFGGLEWTVTHLTKDRAGNAVVTLWLAHSADTHQWNRWFNDNTIMAYPSNVYGTSYLRADALNIGSPYVASEGATSLANNVSQNASHKFAAFTMPLLTNSVTDFLVTPAEIAYQETENQTAGGNIGDVNYTLPNEAYGTPTGTVRWYSSGANINMSTLPSKVGYSSWKDDYIWLPSVTETGYNSTYSGIWRLSNNQRSNSNYTWLRSGRHHQAGGAYGLVLDGNSCSTYQIGRAHV